MKPEDIAAEANRLLKELHSVPEPGMNNYRSLIAEYKRIFNDIVVLIRELAQNSTG